MVPFVALELSLTLIRKLAPVVVSLARHDPDLARQLKRAASSVSLNLAEGSERAGRDRDHCFRIAAGSHREVMTALRVSEAWGHVRCDHEVSELTERLGAILFRLTHRR